ncbi:hypothetical protein CgunFtcFv8_007809 [Champsocephalus gunnari]|uniref:Uncharacterized protein n=1 Tax=Champsocephalus gunnari TaxID=52237 RepID=A0AAN8H6D0_CHAGU|nr:hypothetical protein CgunFtcFv8_007809 [Champsocephalus gunnari]
MASGRINVRTKPCPITGCSYAGKRLDRHVTHDHPEFSRDEAHQVLARLKHSVALQLRHDLRETNPIIGMATSLDIDNEEEYPVHPPPFSPHTECDEEDCRQVMLENVALRAQKDAPIDEVKTLRSRLKKGLKPRKQSATAAVLEEEEECIRFGPGNLKYLRQKHTSLRQQYPSQDPGQDCHAFTRSLRQKYPSQDPGQDCHAVRRSLQ